MTTDTAPKQHPKPDQAWWAAMRDNAGRLRALLGDELQAA